MKVDRSVSPSAERILAAADKLFYRQGIRAVGVDAVAAEAGVSKRTLYNYYPSKDDLIAAYLTARFRHLEPSDAPAREQILGNFDRLERMFADASFRGCPYVNAVTELGDPKHAAAGIALQFKEQRRLWFRALLERLQAREPDDPGALTSRRRQSKLSSSRGNADSPPGANRFKTSASKLCFTDFSQEKPWTRPRQQVSYRQEKFCPPFKATTLH